MSVIIRWLDPNPDPSPVVGFKSHYSDDCATWVSEWDIGMPVPDPDTGVYEESIPLPSATTCVALTAYDSNGLSSDYSNSRDLPEVSGILMLLIGCLFLAVIGRKRKCRTS